ncbi:MAG: DUF4153 domain-containing protein [Flavobacteriales bacterium]|nr:DUF4153 domain-containing protein [Flavobacteriales bacterium]
MKIPSINYLLENAKKAFLRFYLSIISAVLAVSISIYLVEHSDDVVTLFPYINLLLSTSLGIPLYFSVSILLENRPLKLVKKITIYAITTLLLVAIYFSLPKSELTNNTDVPYIRYTLYNLIAHLVVSFIPYLKTAQLNGFWNYNKALFLRFWSAALYSSFLYIGIIIALTSLKLLFDIDIHEELYFEIFIFIIGIFNTWFFVAGIPDNLDELDTVTSYPNGLKIFTQYILLPLLILYLVILYVYGAKIVILSDWPKGIVAYLISGVSTLGIFTLLLIYPYGKLKGNTWIQKFTSLYYYLLFPLIAFLFIAIFIRINDYGVTINRYIIVLLGLWLTLVAVYFSINKTNIKFIPISLAIILALMSFGPWGMFATSERSQVERLKNYLVEGGILVNSSIQNAPNWTLDSNTQYLSVPELKNCEKLSDSVHNEVVSIIEYLESSHGFGSIQAWFHQDIDSIYKSLLDSNPYLETDLYIRSMGLENTHYALASKEIKSNMLGRQYFKCSGKNAKLKQVSGYDLFTEFDIRIHSNDPNIHKAVFPFEENLIYINHTDSLATSLQIQYNDSLLSFQLEDLLKRIYDENINTEAKNFRAIRVVLNSKDRILINKSENLEIKLIIDHLSFFEENDLVQLDYISGDLYLKLIE